MFLLVFSSAPVLCTGDVPPAGDVVAVLPSHQASSFQPSGGGTGIIDFSCWPAGGGVGGFA